MKNENKYYKPDEIAPVECIGRIVCRNRSRGLFRQIVREAKKAGIFYMADKTKKGHYRLSIATDSPEHTATLINALKAQAKMQGVLVE